MDLGWIFMSDDNDLYSYWIRKYSSDVFRDGIRIEKHKFGKIFKIDMQVNVIVKNYDHLKTEKVEEIAISFI